MAKVPFPVGRDFETRLLSCLKRLQRPAYLGELAIDVGYRLETVEHQLMLLQERGAVRKLTQEEVTAMKKHPESLIYVLVDASKFTVVSHLL